MSITDFEQWKKKRLGIDVGGGGTRSAFQQWQKAKTGTVEVNDIFRDPEWHSLKQEAVGLGQKMTNLQQQAESEKDDTKQTQLTEYADLLKQRLANLNRILNAKEDIGKWQYVKSRGRLPEDAEPTYRALEDELARARSYAEPLKKAEGAYEKALETGQLNAAEVIKANQIITRMKQEDEYLSGVRLYNPIATTADVPQDIKQAAASRAAKLDFNNLASSYKENLLGDYGVGHVSPLTGIKEALMSPLSLMGKAIRLPLAPSIGWGTELARREKRAADESQKFLAAHGKPVSISEAGLVGAIGRNPDPVGDYMKEWGLNRPDAQKLYDLQKSINPGVMNALGGALKSAGTFKEAPSGTALLRAAGELAEVSGQPSLGPVLKHPGFNIPLGIALDIGGNPLSYVKFGQMTPEGQAAKGIWADTRELEAMQPATEAMPENISSLNRILEAEKATGAERFGPEFLEKAEAYNPWSKYEQAMSGYRTLVSPRWTPKELANTVVEPTALDKAFYGTMDKLRQAIGGSSIGEKLANTFGVKALMPDYLRDLADMESRSTNIVKFLQNKAAGEVSAATAGVPRADIEDFAHTRMFDYQPEVIPIGTKQTSDLIKLWHKYEPGEPAGTLEPTLKRFLEDYSYQNPGMPLSYPELMKLKGTFWDKVEGTPAGMTPENIASEFQRLATPTSRLGEQQAAQFAGLPGKMAETPEWQQNLSNVLDKWSLTQARMEGLKHLSPGYMHRVYEEPEPGFFARTFGKQGETSVLPGGEETPYGTAVTTKGAIGGFAGKRSLSAEDVEAMNAPIVNSPEWSMYVREGTGSRDVYNNWIRSWLGEKYGVTPEQLQELKELVKTGDEAARSKIAALDVKNPLTWRQWESVDEPFVLPGGTQIINQPLEQGSAYIPKDLQEAIKTINSADAYPHPGFWQSFRDATNWWKNQATVWRPKYFARRLKSDVFRGGYLSPYGVPGSEAWSAAREIGREAPQGTMTLATGAEVPLSDIKELQELLGVRYGGTLGTGGYKTMEQALEGTKTSLNPFSREFALTRLGRGAERALTGGERNLFWTNVLKETGSPGLATEELNRYLYNFGDLAPFESKWMKTVSPFYAWHRQNIPFMLSEFVKEPGKFIPLMSLQESLESQIPASEKLPDFLKPDWMKEGEFFRVPTGGGKPTFVNWNLPYQNVNLLGTPFGDPGDAFFLMNPFLKAPIEYATTRLLGKTLTGQNIGAREQDISPFMAKALGWTGKVPGLKQLAGLIPGVITPHEGVDPVTGQKTYTVPAQQKWALQQMPFLQDINQMTRNDQQDQLYRILGRLTDVQISPVDPERQYVEKLYEAKDDIDAIMKQISSINQMTADELRAEAKKEAKLPAMEVWPQASTLWKFMQEQGIPITEGGRLKALAQYQRAKGKLYVGPAPTLDDLRMMGWARIKVPLPRKDPSTGTWYVPTQKRKMPEVWSGEW